MPSLTFAGRRQLEWRDAEPLAIGHEGVGEVVEVGDRVSSFAPGDRVIMPFQVSCGTCPQCVDGRTGNCSTVPWQSTYGFGFGDAYWGGFLSDLVKIPYADHMLVPLPAGIPPEAAASASDNGPDGYRTVAMLRDRWPGAPVLVVGGAGPGSIGLYAVGHAKALGAERVVYVDADEARRSIAEKLGAETVAEVPDRLDQHFPITVDASANPRGLELALRATAADAPARAASGRGAARPPAARGAGGGGGGGRGASRAGSCVPARRARRPSRSSGCPGATSGG